MWSKKSWGGTINPFIEVTFKKQPDTATDEIVSLLIFEWGDEEYIGMPRKDTNEVSTVYILMHGSQSQSSPTLRGGWSVCKHWQGKVKGMEGKGRTIVDNAYR